MTPSRTDEPPPSIGFGDPIWGRSYRRFRSLPLHGGLQLRAGLRRLGACVSDSLLVGLPPDALARAVGAGRGEGEEQEYRTFHAQNLRRLGPEG